MAFQPPIAFQPPMALNLETKKKQQNLPWPMRCWQLSFGSGLSLWPHPSLSLSVSFCYTSLLLFLECIKHLLPFELSSGGPHSLGPSGCKSSHEFFPPFSQVVQGSPPVRGLCPHLSTIAPPHLPFIVPFHLTLLYFSLGHLSAPKLYYLFALQSPSTIF